MTPERIKIVLDCLHELSREHARNWNPPGNDDGLKGIHNLGTRHCLEDAINFITNAHDHISAVDEENFRLIQQRDAAHESARHAEANYTAQRAITQLLEVERDAALAAREAAKSIFKEILFVPHRSALMRIELKEGIEQRIIAYLGV